MKKLTIGKNIRKITSVVLSAALILIVSGNTLNIHAASGTASLMGTVHSDGGDRNSWIPGTKTVVQGMGYTVQTSTNATRGVAYSNLLTSTVWTLHTHGNKTGVSFPAGNWISYQDISALGSTALSKEKLVFFASCSSGEGGAGPSNMVNIAFQRGAKTVIGYQSTVGTSQNRRFIYEFFVACQSKNIASACSQADYWTKIYHAGNDGGTGNRLIRGSTTVYIN